VLLFKKELWYHYYINHSVEDEPILLLRTGAYCEHIVNMYESINYYVPT